MKKGTPNFMIDLKRVPVLRILIPFTAASLPGIRSFLPAGIHMVLILTCILWILLVAAYRFSWINRPLFSGVFCITAFIFYLLAGYGTAALSEPMDPQLPQNKKVVVRGDILADPSLVNRTWTTEMHVRAVVSGDSCFLTGTVVKLYMKMPPDSVLPACGETWRFFGELSPIRNSGNPGDPDYEKILRRKKCWYRFYAENLPEVNRPMERDDGIWPGNTDLRRAISSRWEGRPEELSLLKALCLGDRSGLTPEMEHDFSHAGGMHILAVSGLHVGLIWWVLFHAFSMLTRLTRREVFRTMLIFMILWMYAWITGFSSSVCRSVTMFSLITLGRMLDQRSSTLNAILVSAFLLIVLDPGRILDVGFQLSYAAVLGIVTIQPVFRRLIRSRNRIIQWIRDATGVSIAAQVATFPLIIHYFHQLPAYAIITSLVAVPLLSCIIGVFVISTPFYAAGICTGLLSWPLTKLGALLNHTVSFIGSLPGSVIGNLYMDRTGMLLLMMLIVLVISILHDRRNLFRYLLMAQLVLILGRNSWSRYQTFHSSEVVAAHFNGGSLLIFREGACVESYIWTGNPRVADRMVRYMEKSWSYRFYGSATFHQNGSGCREESVSGSKEGVVSACRSLCRGAWLVGNDRIRGLVLSGLFNPADVPLLRGRKWDFILLSGEPDVASRIEDLLSPGTLVIVDGSNSHLFAEGLGPHRGQLHETLRRGAYAERW